MKIKLSKSQWEGIGKKAGWIKEAGNGMMPGQTPYTKEELAKLYNMVSDAAKGDQGEAFDSGPLNDADVSKRRFVEVTMSDGDVIKTEINGTKQEIIDYYTKHDFVKGDENTMHHGVEVKFL